MQDLLRFFLALSVVIFHYKHFAIQSALSLPPEDYIAPFGEVLDSIYKHGYHAVSVFFFLSGYMLASHLQDQESHNFSVRNFLVKRIARIYPAHLVTLLAMGILALAVEILGLRRFITYNDDIPNFLASLALLNGIGIMRDTSYNLPSWSLSVEFMCYLAFAFICAHVLKHRAAIFLVALFLGAGITALSSDPNTDNLGTGFVFFFAGAIAALVHRPFTEKLSRFNALAIAVLLSVSALSFMYSLSMALGPQKLAWIFVTLPAFVIAITRIDTIFDRSRYRRFQWFGLVSFSIYIWHFPIQAILFYLFDLTDIYGELWYNSEIVFFTYLGVSLAVAHLSLISVEKFGSQAIRQRYLDE